MGSFRTTRLARARLADIWDYSAETWGPEQAEEYLRRFRSTFQRLADGRAFGRSCRRFAPRCREGILYYTMESHYVIFRITQDEVVEILTIVHTKSDDRLISFLNRNFKED